MKAVTHHVCSYCGKSDPDKKRMIVHESACKVEKSKLDRMESSVKKIRSQIYQLEKDIELEAVATDKKIADLTEEALRRVSKDLERFDIYCISCLDFAKPMRDADGVEYCCACKNPDVLMRGFEINKLSNENKNKKRYKR